MEALSTQLQLVSWLLAVVPVTLQTLGGPQEYCWPRDFNATCARNEIIVMRTARYGRMNKGDCVSSDDHVGCYADVLAHVDHRCSGQHSCLIEIPDDDLHRLQPCPKDMFSYLEADYVCQEVEMGEGRSCGYPSTLTLSGPSGYLASVVTEELGHGSHRCPWVIALQPGQRINITLLDFGVAARFTETGNMCHVYAKIKERGMASEITICGSLTRERSVYISETNKIEVQIMSFKMEREPVYFTLKYDAIGCTDPVAPAGAWLKRNGDRAVVSCNFTTQAWHIVCHGNEWFGQIENCSIPNIEPQKGTLQDPKDSFPYGLLVAVVTGVVLGVVIGIAMLSLVLACHRRRKKRRAGNTTDPTYGTHLEPRDGGRFVETPKSFVTDTGYGGGGYGYTHVCGLRAMYQYTQDQLASKECLDRPDIQPDVHTCTHDYEGFERTTVGGMRSTGKPDEHGTVLYSTYDPSREGDYDTNIINKYGTAHT